MYKVTWNVYDICDQPLEIHQENLPLGICARNFVDFCAAWGGGVARVGTEQDILCLKTQKACAFQNLHDVVIVNQFPFLHLSCS